jgi:hypothetical protein
MKYDDYAEGTFDKNNPANQPDQSDEFLCITDLLGACEYDEAFEKINEVRKELIMLRDTAKLIQNSYLKNRLTTIIQKI